MKRHGASRVRPGTEGRAPNQPNITVETRLATKIIEVMGMFMPRSLERVTLHCSDPARAGGWLSYMSNTSPDRGHNREEDSPEALRRSIDALAEAVAALDQRLGEVTLRLDGELDGAKTTTRRLATEVGFMGEALVRRMEAERLRSSSARPRRKPMWPLALAMTVALMSIIACFVVIIR